MNSIGGGNVEYLLWGEQKQMNSLKILSNYVDVLNFCLIIMFLEKWVEIFPPKPYFKSAGGNVTLT